MGPAIDCLVVSARGGGGAPDGVYGGSSAMIVNGASTDEIRSPWKSTIKYRN
jgi:hypothetical protein